MTSKSYSERLAKGAVIIFVFTLLANFIGYLVRFFLTRQLNVADYGLFYSLLSFVSLFIIFSDPGFGSALVKFIPEFLAKKDYSKLKSLVAFIFGIRFVLSLSVAVLIFSFSDYFALNLFHSLDVSPLIKIFSLFFFIDSFISFETTFFTGFQRPFHFSSIPFLKNLTFFLLLLLITPLNIEKTIYAFLFSSFMVSTFFLPSVFWTLKKNLKWKVKKIKITRKFIKTITSFAIPVFFGAIAYSIIGYTDTIMLTFFRSLEEVGYYQVALPTSRLLWVIVFSLTTLLFPMSSELWASNKKHILSKGLTIITKISFMIMVPAVLITIAFARFILDIFFGATYITATACLQILSLAALFFLIRAIFSSVLVGIGQPIVNTKVGIFMAIFNVIANLILIPIYGIVGAAAATTTSFLFGAIISFFYIRKFITFKMPFVSLIKSLFNGFLTLATISYLKQVINIPPIQEAALLSIVAVVVYIFLTVISKNIRKQDIKILRKANIRIPKKIWTVLVGQ